MQEAVGSLRGLLVTGLSTLRESRVLGLNTRKQFEQKILRILRDPVHPVETPSAGESSVEEGTVEEDPVRIPVLTPQDVTSSKDERCRSSNEIFDKNSSRQSIPTHPNGVYDTIREVEEVLSTESGKEHSTNHEIYVESLKREEESTASFRSLGASSRERKVPSTPIGRVLGFAGMGANLAYGVVQNSVVSLFRSQPTAASSMMSERNAEVLAAGLCRMRGAALKLGQMLSIQDEAVIPPYLQQALDRVRAGADYMPRHQLERVLRQELGKDWSQKFDSFDFVPMAAASIGQVHKAVLPDGTVVAMKIQYPGVADSIESDLNNLLTLMKVADVLPKGLYVDIVVRVMRKELAMECDYEYELQSQKKFKELIEGEPSCREKFYVPAAFPELSTKQILVSEWVKGIPIDKVQQLGQTTRNDVGGRLLHITMLELFQWRFMQTDPNWGNFLYDPESDRLALIDFGAAKEFPRTFTDAYLKMVAACAEKNSERVISCSQNLGFLTGDENKAMIDAHCAAAFIVGLPFSKAERYDFSQHSKLTGRVAQLGTVMLKNRLCPPPEESYSLHRKLSGAFLCCIKLGSVIPSHQMFYSVLEKHEHSI